VTNESPRGAPELHSALAAALLIGQSACVRPRSFADDFMTNSIDAD
jgi:hypothetical protein